MDLAEFERQWRDDSRDFIVAHTSGSTGRPKEIRLLKEDMRASARATIMRFGIGPRSVLALPLSLDYIAGKMMAVRAFESGAELRVIEPRNEFEYDGHAALLAIVPSQAPWLIAHPQWAATTGAVIIGGAPLPLAMQRALAQAGYNAFCTYGMTETCSHVALQKITPSDPAPAPSAHPQGPPQGGQPSSPPISASREEPAALSADPAVSREDPASPEPFLAMPGITFSLDPRGCLVIHSEAFSWRRLVTNDIVELLSPTSFYWLGRFDNVINSGGVKILAEDLEAQISRFFRLPFYIRPIPDPKWGQAIEMVVEAPDSVRHGLQDSSPRKDAKPIHDHHPTADDELAALPDLLAAHLERKFIPKKITLVDSLPRTSTGKIKRLPHD